MKKVLAILTILMMMAACCAEELTDDERQFKLDNEILNGQTTMDGMNFYREIEIPEDNNISYIELSELLTVLESGTGVVYFGFPECPWCRTLMPVLFEAMRNAGYTGVIYYCNCPEQRDFKSLADDGSIVTDSEGTEDYAALVEKLDGFLGPYNGLNDESIKRLYFPTCVFFKDGQVLDAHLVTVDTQESGYDDLTEEQHAELLEALEGGFKLLTAE